MAKAPPKSLRITHGLRTAVNIRDKDSNTEKCTRDPGYDLRAPWKVSKNKGGKRRVYEYESVSGSEQSQRKSAA